MGRILSPLASTEEAIIRGSFIGVEDPADAPRLRRDLHSRDPWSNSAERERERERERGGGEKNKRKNVETNANSDLARTNSLFDTRETIPAFNRDPLRSRIRFLPPGSRDGGPRVGTGL